VESRLTSRSSPIDTVPVLAENAREPKAMSGRGHSDPTRSARWATAGRRQLFRQFTTVQALTKQETNDLTVPGVCGMCLAAL
jgi:hypothetical protein